MLNQKVGELKHQKDMPGVLCSAPNKVHLAAFSVSGQRHVILRIMPNKSFVL